MVDIQYDPACVDCRREAARQDASGTTWQCNGHVRAERDWLRAKLANVMVEWDHDVEVLTKERNAALTLAEQRGAAYDLMLREVEAVDKGAAAWKRMADELEAEWDRFRERLDQFEAYGFPNVAAVLDRIAFAPPADAATEAVREAAARLATWTFDDHDTSDGKGGCGGGCVDCATQRLLSALAARRGDV